MRQVEISSDTGFIRVHDCTNGEDPFAIAMMMHDTLLALGYTSNTAIHVFERVLEECNPDYFKK